MRDSFEEAVADFDKLERRGGAEWAGAGAAVRPVSTQSAGGRHGRVGWGATAAQGRPSLLDDGETHGKNGMIDRGSSDMGDAIRTRTAGPLVFCDEDMFERLGTPRRHRESKKLLSVSVSSRHDRIPLLCLYLLDRDFLFSLRAIHPDVCLFLFWTRLTPLCFVP